MNKKVEVTVNYLESVLEALEDAKGLCEAYSFKNTFSKHINRTKKIIQNNKIKEIIKK
jgi:hypothetical protein